MVNTKVAIDCAITWPRLDHIVFQLIYPTLGLKLTYDIITRSSKSQLTGSPFAYNPGTPEISSFHSTENCFLTIG
jgi:hypothetical protein